jgi:hypothetical protein
MTGAQRAESGNFPLGEGARDAIAGKLKAALDSMRPLGKRLLVRWVSGDFDHLAPANLARRSREIPWPKSASELKTAFRQILSQRDVWGTLLLTQVVRAAPKRSKPFRALLPSLPWPEVEDPVATDFAWVILTEFEALETAKQTATARNVALLWDCFVEEFGGVSGFLAATSTEQNHYLEKLDAAAQRMEVGRYSAVGYHYVSVVLVKLYVTYLHGQNSAPSAIALSSRVAMLINDGRVIRAKESKSPIMVIAHNDGSALRTSPQPETRVEVQPEPSQYASFRIGYVSQPAMRTRI